MSSTINESMGKITTTLVVTNRLDQGLATGSLIPAEPVRSITLNDILVDTGKTS